MHWALAQSDSTRVGLFGRLLALFYYWALALFYYWALAHAVSGPILPAWASSDVCHGRPALATDGLN